VNPPELFCSSRIAGVLLVAMCRSSTGVEVRNPILPVESMNSELAGAPALKVAICRLAVWSKMPRKFAPPLALSLAMICQSFAGKAPTEVSSNSRRAGSWRSRSSRC
jgi:hypothetical protein